MRINLKLLSHGPLSWTDSLPENFKGVRLPGSSLIATKIPAGTICIQEIQEKYFTLQYKVFDLIEDFKVTEQLPVNGLFSRVILNGSVKQHSENNTNTATAKQTFLFNLPGTLTTTYTKNLCIVFDLCYHSKLIEDVLNDYPALLGSVQTTSFQPAWADMETFELIDSILNCKFSRDFRKLYFDTRVRDLLFKFLVLVNQVNIPLVDPISPDTQAVYEAERIIGKDIHRHFRIPELAKKVGLSETRLKLLFKKTLGLGPYEYLVKLRMKKAKELLEEGHAIKKVAIIIGYRPSHFTTVFRQHFNIPPSDVKRKEP